MSSLQIRAPFAGWCTGLDEVPDPVFAGRMLGDGLAIDPIQGIVTAPCAGQIITLPASAHAVSIRPAAGIDILIHIGIDTVQLAGRGFSARVSPGMRVRAGDELIRFDLDAVARAAKSLMTPILVTPMDGLDLRQRRAPGAVAAGDLLFEIAGAAGDQPPPDPAGGKALRVMTMPLRQGLHARPAALLALSAKDCAAQISLHAHGRKANARSVVSLMALGLRFGEDFSIEATGMDAEQSLASMANALQDALRLEGQHQPAAKVFSESFAPRSASPTDPTTLGGVTAVAGFAMGRAARIERPELEVIEGGAGIAQETLALDQARTQARARLTRLAASGDAARRDIIAAHLEFIDDPQLNAAAQELLAQDKSAGFAWRGAIRRFVAELQSLEDPRLRERADDLIDVESHVLLALAGEARPMKIYLPEESVLLADDLLPSELTALDRDRLRAICLKGGGATSHVAILAAAMEIPMLIGLGEALQDIAEGAPLIVDADHGLLQTAPSAAALDQARHSLAAERRRRLELRAEAQTECRALDGTRVEVFANLGNAADAAAAVLNGAEGCGLLRTEFLFIDRDTAPDEDEQLKAYQEIAATLGARPMILRLMDVGGDKPLRYLPLPAEANPALGLRGVRTALARPDLLRAQLRAALRVQPPRQVRLLIPMVTDLSEIRAVRALADAIASDLALSQPIEFGAMIETPAAALLAGRLLEQVDFLSIGSNDLTQYTLAMDRGHPDLAQRADALHPAVLRLIAAAGAAGAATGKLVAVCGGVAADPHGVPLLLGLGVRELSVVPALVPAIKRQVRSLRIEQCRELALQCLDLASAREVRDRVAQTPAMTGDQS